MCDGVVMATCGEAVIENLRGRAPVLLEDAAVFSRGDFYVVLGCLLICLNTVTTCSSQKSERQVESEC